MNIKRILCCFLLLTTLAACASKEEEKEQEAKDEATKEEKAAEAKAAVDTYKPHLICPQVAIIRELEKVEDYGTENAAAGQLVAGARLKSIEGTCSYQKKGIDIAFTLGITAVKGPRLGGDKATFPYFIAVVDPNQTILNKDQMSAEFKFKSDESSTAQEVQLHIFIPLPRNDQPTGPDFRVLAGFQLTQEQLDQVRLQEKAAVGLPTSTQSPHH